MKFQSNSFRNLLDSLTINEVKNLTKEVKETIAAEFSNERKRVFTSAELWKIQRNKKNVFNRRAYF
jgi:hypothetical protein